MDIMDWLDAHGTVETHIAYDLIVAQQYKITALEARNRELESALNKTTQYYPVEVVECRGDKCRLPNCASCCDTETNMKAINESIDLAVTVNELLATTPTNALDRFENEVIERCAGFIENGNFLTDSSLEYKLAIRASKEIRSLKKEVK